MSREEQGGAEEMDIKRNCPKPKQILRNVFEVITS